MLKTIMNIRIIAKLRITTIFEITLTKWIINEKSIVIITDHGGLATTSYRLIKWYITQPTNKPTNKQLQTQLHLFQIFINSTVASSINSLTKPRHPRASRRDLITALSPKLFLLALYSLAPSILGKNSASIAQQLEKESLQCYAPLIKRLLK